jgi:predicted deacylase
VNHRKPFVINGHSVLAGTRRIIHLPIGVFTNNAPVDLSVVTIHGQKPGPTLLLTGCIHGDEINGAEIIRRLLRDRSLTKMRGTLLAVPIVNVPAFLNRSRYLPDRRDLNRLFPGSSSGSLGSRIARIITETLIPRADAVIDLHTGAVNRANLPQTRITADDEPSMAMAEAFHSPVTLKAPVRGNSFRSSCAEAGKPMVLFESGEALRLDAPSIRFGLQGVISVMRHLEMLPKRKSKAQLNKVHTVVCKRSYWERAPSGGIFTPLLALGKTVDVGTTLGFIADPYGEIETPVTATRAGILIGRTNEGLADEGDGLFHIGVFANLEEARDQIAMTHQYAPDQFDEMDDHPVPYDPFTDDVVDSDS